MAEQRYRAVLAVIGEGLTLKDVAAAVGVSRQTLHTWLARYEAGGLERLGDRSHRPRSCPHHEFVGRGRDRSDADQAPEVGPRRLAFELGRQDLVVRHWTWRSLPSVSIAPSRLR